MLDRFIHIISIARAHQLLIKSSDVMSRWRRSLYPYHPICWVEFGANRGE